MQPRHDCPVSIRPACFEYHQEASGFDCSVDSAFTMHLPDEEFIRLLNLNWSGEAANFRDSAGQLATTDPSAFESGPAALLLRQDLVEEMAESKGFSICWTVVGEKLAYLPGPMQRTGQIHISGACALRNGRIEGFVHVIKDSPRQELSEGILTTKRF